MKWLKRLLYRIAEEDAAVNGRYAEALHWLRKGRDA